MVTSDNAAGHGGRWGMKVLRYRPAADTEETRGNSDGATSFLLPSSWGQTLPGGGIVQGGGEDTEGGALVRGREVTPVATVQANLPESARTGGGGDSGRSQPTAVRPLDSLTYVCEIELCAG